MERFVAEASEHFGRAISIKGYSGAGLAGSTRHAKDTDAAICLTLYGQDGELQELIVPRSRDMELFQEWLRRYDRYTAERGDCDGRP